MIISDMHFEFKLGLDKVDSLAYPDFLDKEIDTFLNIAQERIVKTRYNLNNFYQKSFEEIQKRIDDIKILVTDYSKPFTNTDYEAFSPNLETYQFPISQVPNYWFRLRELLQIETLNCTCEPCKGYYNITQVQNDDYSRIIIDPFNKPALRYGISLYSSFIEINLGGKIDLTKYKLTYHLRYLRKPIQMNLRNNISCELSDHLHREIIDDAVRLAIENIESPRLQTNTLLNSNKE